MPSGCQTVPHPAPSPLGGLLGLTLFGALFWALGSRLRRGRDSLGAIS